MTLVAAVLDPQARTVQVARAGHTTLFHYENARRENHHWAPQGIGLALDRGEVFEKTLMEEKRKLGSGDVLFFYSDGLIEAENPDGDEFGEERLEDLFLKAIEASAADIGKTIIAGIQTFAQDQPQKDDMTLVVVKVG